MRLVVTPRRMPVLIDFAYVGMIKDKDASALTSGPGLSTRAGLGINVSHRDQLILLFDEGCDFINLDDFFRHWNVIQSQLEVH